MIVGQPIINGVSYTHADILVNIFGIPLIGITGIEYGDPQDITGNYSTGQHMTSVGFGQVKPFARITLTLECLETIQNLAPNGRLQNIPFFDVGINFLPEGGVLVRHSLKKCRIKGRNTGSQTGNSEITETLELFVADVNYKA